MSLFLAIAGWTVYGLVIVCGLALNLVGLFGNWLILSATAVAWLATGLEHFSLLGLGIMLVLAVLGEVIEAAAAALGTSRFGGSGRAAIAAVAGALVGAVFGTPIFPVIGTLAGACLGAFGAAMVYEYIQYERTAREAAWTGLGAAIGRIGGLLGKFAMGLVMLGVAFVTY